MYAQNSPKEFQREKLPSKRKRAVEFYNQMLITGSKSTRSLKKTSHK